MVACHTEAGSAATTQGRKSAPLMLGLPRVRCGSRDCGVPGSFYWCDVALTLRSPKELALRSAHSGAELSRSADRADARSPRWFDCVPSATLVCDRQFRKWFLSPWLRRWRLDGECAASGGSLSGSDVPSIPRRSL